MLLYIIIVGNLFIISLRERSTIYVTLLGTISYIKVCKLFSFLHTFFMLFMYANIKYQLKCHVLFKNLTTGNSLFIILYMFLYIGTACL